MPLLQWLNDEEARSSANKVPYRLLEEQPKLSYGDSDSHNMLIQGDNLDALKALLPYYAGKVKCIFIDPPYNTKSAFEHYDDNLEHSQWLTMMYPRLELLRELLAEDGSIWITIDDRESHYLKVMLDEIFGRNNFVANCIWEKVYSERMDAKGFSISHDHILVFQKSEDFSVNQVKKAQNKKQFNFFDDTKKMNYRRRSLRKEGSESLRKDRPSMWYPITAPDGSLVYPVKPDGVEGRWRWKKENVEKKIKDLDFVKKDNSWEIYVKQYLNDDATRPPATLFESTIAGHNHEAKLEAKQFNGSDVFSTPKPEKLMRQIIELSTSDNDLILDSFLGSGTTAAVAHKMGRQYIGIELGEHAQTHCLPRLQKVVDGEQGGISKDVEWQGGGGFHFYRLGEAVFDEEGHINPDIKFAPLAAHVWFSETGIPYQGKADSPFLGIHDDVAYALLYNGILGDKRPNGGNVLTRKVLEELQQLNPDFEGSWVIYGESSRITPTKLDEQKITFKQTPYDIRAR